MLILWFLLLNLVFLACAGWVFARVFLIGPGMERYDAPRAEIPAARRSASPENAEVLRLIDDFRREVGSGRLISRIAETRRLLDAGIAGTPVSPEALQVERLTVDAGGVPAEWIRVPASDPNRRLLYIHGGAFTAGSPDSHRYITAGLARLASVSVLAIDYRLMPEHARRAGITDCKTAYQWMLEHGPDRAAPATSAYVAGDSAGGNLTLVLIAWLRDARLRQADAAIALAPLTDATLSSPTMRTHVASDPFLGPSMGRITRMPRSVVAYLTLFANRMTPKNPLLSPLRGNLAGLPPTLLQVSASEMLFDDAQRYVNKARESGSPVEIQIWNDMVHVWQLFLSVLPESRDALQDIAGFVQRHPGAGS